MGNKNLDYCLICKRSRHNDEGEELWQSDLILSPTKTSDDLVFTVCPSCRKKPISEIYLAIMKDEELF